MAPNGDVHGKSSLPTYPQLIKRFRLRSPFFLHFSGRKCRGLLFHQRNPEAESCPLAGPAGDADLAAMSSENGARNRKPHACTLAPPGAGFAAIEFFEDERKVGRIDSRTVVLDRELQAATEPPAGKADAPTTRDVA